MTVTSQKIITAMFVVSLLVAMVGAIMLPDREFSEFENRMLAQMPDLRLKYVLDGRFTKKFEKYITDQFPFRNNWVALKSDIERLLLKTENNGIFFGKEGYLLKHNRKPSDVLLKNIAAINSFAARLGDVSAHLLLAPNSAKVYAENLPLFASPYDQMLAINDVKNKLSQNVSLTNAYETLVTKKNEYIYFRTDHHWTMRGAYYAYRQLAESLGITPYELDDFDSEIVTNEFFGSYYCRANNRHVQPDSIEVFKPKFPVAYEVYYADEDWVSHSLYEEDHLKSRDKYSLFLDGNHALVTIKTSVKNGKSIAVIKDSYSHCLLPFLANHYEEVHVIDLRYYHSDVYEYVSDNHVTDVVFLYGVETFSEDENIKHLR